MKINFKEKLYLSKEEVIEKANELLELNEAEKVTTILFLQQRIDKAIEYIENAQTLDYGTTKEFNIKEFPFVQHILEILKGKSE